MNCRRIFEADFSQPKARQSQQSGAGNAGSNLLVFRPMNFLESTWVGSWLNGLGRIAVLARDAIASCLTFKASRRDLLYQIYFIGIKSQAVVLVTGAFTGMVLTAQTYFQFHKVKMDTATLAVVGVSMCDELGPVLTALMVAGRVGAAIAAEIGTMRVTEQIDALRTLATHPIDYLVVPRLLASIIALPLLTMEAIVLGIISGYVIGTQLLGIDPTYLYYDMMQYMNDADVVFGLVKSFVYGGIVALIGCYKGLTCGMGAEGVGRATTEAVVYSSITILITNFFLTLFLQRLYVLMQ
jgi:phospholipid/cholesterol/gamma-HCH transport system permease protein